MEDPYFTCPFDEVHRIRKSRMQFHIVRCSKNHRMTNKVRCPFNPLHIIDSAEILSHCKNCENNATIQLQEYTRNDVKCFAGEISPDEYRRQLEENLPNTDDWEKRYSRKGAGYDPAAASASKLVYRSLNCESKSKREQFRHEERRRFADLEEEKFGALPKHLRRPHTLPHEHMPLIPNEQKNNIETSKTRPPKKTFTESEIRETEFVLNNNIPNRKVAGDGHDENMTTNYVNDDNQVCVKLNSLSINDYSNSVILFRELEHIEEQEKNLKHKKDALIEKLKTQESLFDELLPKKVNSAANNCDVVYSKKVHNKTDDKEDIKRNVANTNGHGKGTVTKENKNSVNDPVNKRSGSNGPYEQPKGMNFAAAVTARAQPVPRQNPRCAANFDRSPLSPTAPTPGAPNNGIRQCGRGIVHAYNQKLNGTSPGSKSRDVYEGSA